MKAGSSDQFGRVHSQPAKNRTQKHPLGATRLTKSGSWTYDIRPGLSDQSGSCPEHDALEPIDDLQGHNPPNQQGTGYPDQPSKIQKSGWQYKLNPYPQNRALEETVQWGGEDRRSQASAYTHETPVDPQVVRKVQFNSHGVNDLGD